MELGPGLVQKLGLAITRAVSHSPAADYYCSQCGEERQAKAVEDSSLPLPPYCRECLEVQRRAAQVDARVLASVQEAWAEALPRLLQAPVLDAVAVRSHREAMAELRAVLDPEEGNGKADKGG